MSVTVIHLLRHGKVQNPGDILYGRLPGYRLAASGQAMAVGVADYLAGSDVTYLVASSLQRAQETAAPVARTFGLPIVTDDRIIEAANDFEGRSFALNADTLASPRTWLKLRDPFKPSWGEPYLDIAHRMLGAIYDAVRAAEGHQAVLVSHQLPIVTARRYLHGQRLWHDPRRRSCSVASLTSLSFTDGVFTGSSYAEPVAHIAAVNDAAVNDAAVNDAAVNDAAVNDAAVNDPDAAGTAPSAIPSGGAAT